MLLLTLLATNNSQATDESSDLRGLWKVIVSEEETASLKDQMALIGLSPLRRDPRVFQPDADKPLSLKQLPPNIPPFGLNLSSGNTSNEQLISLQAHPNLYSLSLDGFANGEACLTAIREQTSLRFLSVVDCGLTDDQLSQLTKLPHLETLDLRRTRINGPGLAALKSLTELKSLEIDMTADQFHALKTNQLVHLLPIAHGENRTTAANDEEITELELNGFYGYPVTNQMLLKIDRLTSLRELSLIESQVDNEAIPQLIRLQRLQKLNLERSRIDDEALRILANARALNLLVLDETKITADGLRHLEKLEHLTEVRLNRCKLDDTSLHILGTLAHLNRLEIGATEIRFEHNTVPGLFRKLEHLNVNGSQVTDSGIANIAQLPELNWLDLTRCRISNEGLKSLAACRKLEVLYLNLTPISDKDLLPLSSIESLRVLSLNSTAITDVGLRHLSGMKGLRSLILFGTQTSQSAVQQLQSELPDCEIVR
jgi:internalin A